MGYVEGSNSHMNDNDEIFVRKDIRSDGTSTNFIYGFGSKDADEDEAKEFAEKVGYHISNSKLFTEPDMVNSPPHYKGRSRFGYPAVESLKCISSALNDDEYRGFCKGNAFKYIFRDGRKGRGNEDLEKAIFYLEEALGKHSEETKKSV